MCESADVRHAQDFWWKRNTVLAARCLRSCVHFLDSDRKTQHVCLFSSWRAASARKWACCAVLKSRNHFEQTEIYTQHTLNCDVWCDHQSRRNSWRDEWSPSCSDITLTQNWSSPWNTLDFMVSHLGCIYTLCWIQNSAVISCYISLRVRLESPD